MPFIYRAEGGSLAPRASYSVCAGLPMIVRADWLSD